MGGTAIGWGVPLSIFSFLADCSSTQLHELYNLSLEHTVTEDEKFRTAWSLLRSAYNASGKNGREVGGGGGGIPLSQVFLPRVLGTSLVGGTLLFMSAVFDDEGSWGRVSSPLQSSGASVSWKRLHVCTGISDAVRVIVT